MLHVDKEPVVARRFHHLADLDDTGHAKSDADGELARFKFLFCDVDNFGHWIGSFLSALQHVLRSVGSVSLEHTLSWPGERLVGEIIVERPGAVVVEPEAQQ